MVFWCLWFLMFLGFRVFRVWVFLGFRVPYRGYIGIMEKKMEATITLGFSGIGCCIWRRKWKLP